jgi:AcrR family transcriptional regulator
VNVVHSPTKSRPGRRERRLDQILATASGLVAKEGLEGLTLHRLARELDYVPAALYRYFASKDALLAELQRRTIETLHGEFRRARERAADQTDAGRRALTELELVCALYLDLPKRAPEHFGLISVMLADPRPLIADAEAQQTAPLLMAFLGEVRDVLQAASDAGALRPGSAFDRTLVLWASIQGIAQLGKISRFAPRHFDVKRLGREALRALLAGWGAAEEELDAAETAAKPKGRGLRQTERT